MEARILSPTLIENLIKIETKLFEAEKDYMELIHEKYEKALSFLEKLREIPKEKIIEILTIFLAPQLCEVIKKEKILLGLWEREYKRKTIHIKQDGKGEEEIRKALTEIKEIKEKVKEALTIIEGKPIKIENPSHHK